MASDVYVKSECTERELELIRLGCIMDGTFIGFEPEDFDFRIVFNDSKNSGYDKYLELIDDGYDEY